jgi:SAM-dependent methyltransferase
MAHFHLSMQHVKLPMHRSSCPLCGNGADQEGWLMGIPGLNLSRITAVALANGTLLEAALSYCPTCDFGYFHPAPSRQFLDAFYGAGGGVDDSVPDATRLKTLQAPNFQTESIQILSMMQLSGIDLASKRSGRALEVGPGYACYAQLFQMFGMEYWANEMGQGSAAFLTRNFGARIVAGALDEIPDSLDASFELIFSKDSFEHHPDPLASIRRCCRLLRPGGHLVITVPNLHSKSLQTQSVTHPYFAFPPHLNYFTRKSFERVLGSEGMQSIEIRTFSFQSEIHYCMELGIKLGLYKPESEYLDQLSATDGHERLFVVAAKGPSGAVA